MPATGTALSTATAIRIALETAILNAAPGAMVVATGIDGLETRYDYAEAQKMLIYWKRQEALLSGRIRTSSQINLQP